MSNDCLFCKIFNGDIPAEKVYHDEKVMAFKDIAPMAPIHLLFIHNQHTSNVNEITKNDPSQLHDLFKAIATYTEQNDLSEKGFRVVINQGPHAGQAVFHTHVHVLGGERLGKFGSKLS